MKVRVLGCSGAIAKDCRTTSFLIDGDILIDAGTGVGDLTLDEMRGIGHVFLTHSHADHINGLPALLFQLALADFEGKLPIYGNAPTLALARRVIEAFGLLKGPFVAVDQLAGQGGG